MRSVLSISARRWSIALCAAAAAIMMSVSPATASGTSVVAYTTDGPGVIGGKGIFRGGQDPENMEVCDTKADGMRAWAQFTWDGSTVTLEDADGATDFCENPTTHWKQVQIVEGRTVTVKVCRRDGASGPLKDCGYVTGKS